MQGDKEGLARAQKLAGWALDHAVCFDLARLLAAWVHIRHTEDLGSGAHNKLGRLAGSVADCLVGIMSAESHAAALLVTENLQICLGRKPQLFMS